MSGGACSGDYINATEVDHLGALSLLRIILLWYNIHTCLYEFGTLYMVPFTFEFIIDEKLIRYNLEM